ncbi:hypothetical protein [Pseudohoeflea coraliihabitans]|uniref:Uncharacterized protein n=1 Tax=Pseudohoeflea coraliihabitans TaxID=2860393 RepID=A0ABS6WTH6_9HYPH|nr:hypothetical protein [Pseudohoeflea sp. DP4N28-3]MBW3099250.1 hypothetical protein [Pseudohoeflea sp. DP4N28-3]
MSEVEDRLEEATDLEFAGDMASEEFDRALKLSEFYALLDGMAEGAAIRVLLDEGRREAISGMLALAVADPDDAKTIRDLQWRVVRFGKLAEWIREIVENGKSSQDDLEAESRAALEKLIRTEANED